MLIKNLSVFYPLISSILSMLVSQLVKSILIILAGKKIKSAALLRSGGMPSSHSALITAVTVSMGLKEGFNSNLFFICVIFSLIVIYDARGIRHTVGKHAKLLNKTVLIENPKKLNEYIGHTLPEIIVGISIGLIISFGMYHLIKI